MKPSKPHHQKFSGRLLFLLALSALFFSALAPDLSRASSRPQRTEDRHARAEMLWQQGQELYSRGKTRLALKKFKESFQLEPDEDKGSYIAWLVSELERPEDAGAEEEWRTVAIETAGVCKALRLPRHWKAELSDENDYTLSPIREGRHYAITVFDRAESCRSPSCRATVVAESRRGLTRSFHITGSGSMEVSGRKIHFLSMVPKEGRRLPVRFYFPYDSARVYSVLLIHEGKEAPYEAQRVLRSILARLSEDETGACRGLSPIQRVLIDLKRTKSEVEKLFRE